MAAVSRSHAGHLQFFMKNKLDRLCMIAKTSYHMGVYDNRNNII